MAQGKKTGGRDIQKGQVLLGAGRPKLPEDLKSARKLNRIEFEETVNKYLFMSFRELQEKMRDPEIPMLDLSICTLLVKASSLGCQKRLAFVLDRVLGKVGFNDAPTERRTVQLSYNVGDKPEYNREGDDEQ